MRAGIKRLGEAEFMYQRMLYGQVRPFRVRTSTGGS